MALDPREILAEVAPMDVPAEQPPAESNYRDADIQGVACAFCVRFHPTGFDERDGVLVPHGVCDLWEANVDGVMVCDSYAENTPPLDGEGNEVWDMAGLSDVDSVLQWHEVHCAGTETRERDGKVVKGILRTGHWPVTPTTVGKIPKPLTIVRDGRSDHDKGIISLTEVVSNFKAHKPVRQVQIPLTDEQYKDHKNLTRLNTGFVRDVWIEDEDGVSHLLAEFDFTEPEVREKALRGTYADVSSGIPFHPQLGAFLEHVAITNQPFIDGLRGYLAASDAPEAVADAEVVHHVLEAPAPAREEPEERESEVGQVPEGGDPPEVKPGAPAPNDSTASPASTLSYRTIVERTQSALVEQLNLATSTYEVVDATPDTVTVRHTLSGTTWTAPFAVAEDKITLEPFEKWTVIEDAGSAEPPETPPASHGESTEVDELQAARQLREMRVQASAQHKPNPNGGAGMPISREELDRLELSDAQRAPFLALLDENASLTSKTREADADARIEELKRLGFADRPGALKLYRRVFLSDDGGPAIVLFSDDDESKEKLTAIEILDQFIAAVKGSEDKIMFSDQHVESGNDNKPPVDDAAEPVEKRVEDAKAFLYPNRK